MACGLIIVERKYQTAMMNTVIPLIFIGWLGVAGGLIPSESGLILRPLEYAILREKISDPWKICYFRRKNEFFDNCNTCLGIHNDSNRSKPCACRTKIFTTYIMAGFRKLSYLRTDP